MAITGRGITRAVPGGSSGGPPTKGEGLPHASSGGPATRGGELPQREQSPELAVVERAIDALRDFSGLMRRKKEDPLFVRVGEALGGEVETRGRERMGEVVRYILDDQYLLWYEVELSGMLPRRTSIVAVPGILVADVLVLVHCQNGRQGSAGRYHHCATDFIAQEGVGTRGSMSCRAGAGVGSERVASV